MKKIVRHNRPIIYNHFRKLPRRMKINAMSAFTIKFKAARACTGGDHCRNCLYDKGNYRKYLK